MSGKVKVRASALCSLSRIQEDSPCSRGKEQSEKCCFNSPSASKRYHQFGCHLIGQNIMAHPTRKLSGDEVLWWPKVERLNFFEMCESNFALCWKNRLNCLKCQYLLMLILLGKMIIGSNTMDRVFRKENGANLTFLFHHMQIQKPLKTERESHYSSLFRKF